MIGVVVSDGGNVTVWVAAIWRSYRVKPLRASTLWGGTAQSIPGGGDNTDDFGIYVVLGTATSVTVDGGGSAIVSAGGVASTTVNSGGSAIVSAGGLIVSTMVNPGGAEDVFSGGIASGTKVRGGIEVVSFGGTDIGATVRGFDLGGTTWRER